MDNTDIDKADAKSSSAKSLINNGTHSSLWHARFTISPSAKALDFETSIRVDSRLALDDIRGSKAHAGMLCAQGIISAEDYSAIKEGLSAIEGELLAGTLKIDEGAEDIHSFIEAVLTDKIGDAARRLHTGRSRNDQIALDEKLYLKRTIPALEERLKDTIHTLAALAGEHAGHIMPGYTHMQRAQPITLGEHLCAWAYSLKRDDTRLKDALERMDECPLGAGALAGSTLELDRDMVASSLGFTAGASSNAMDSVSDRDYCIETISALCTIMVHLSRFCNEIVLWSTWEYGFIQLSEAWSTGSSIMPQKKNPDFAELIRGKAARVEGDLVTIISLMKGLPYAYNRDMQEDKEPLFDAYDTVYSCLEVFKCMIESAKFNVGRMLDSCNTGYLNATDAADYLVRKGLPFRKAHEVAASLTRKAIDKGVKIEELSIQELKAASSLIEEDIADSLSIEACVQRRNTKGAPSKERVAEQVAELLAYCKKEYKGERSGPIKA